MVPCFNPLTSTSQNVSQAEQNEIVEEKRRRHVMRKRVPQWRKSWESGWLLWKKREEKVGMGGGCVPLFHGDSHNNKVDLPNLV
jgi:hypothetical protein